MPILSYLVIPTPGAKEAVEQALSALPGCDVIPSTNRDVLMLITETSGPEEEDRLRSSVEEIPEIDALLLTFGDIGSAGVGRAPDRTDVGGRR